MGDAREPTLNTTRDTREEKKRNPAIASRGRMLTAIAHISAAP